MRAAATLLGTPSDLGGWVDLGDALAESGRAGQAARVFQALGESASSLGSVGLAAACARWLLDRGLKAAGDKLTASIAATHCKGSRAVSTAVLAVPPLAPPGPDDSSEKETPDDLDQAVGDALGAAISAARQRAPRVLPPTPLVRALPADDFHELVGVMRLRRCAPGEVIVDVGEPAVALYWIARGDVEISRDGVVLGDLHPNAFFGEIALVGGTLRTARVSARAACWLIEVPAEAIERVAVRAPRLAHVLAVHARTRILANVMRTSDLFARLGDEERAAVLPRFDVELFEAGQTILSRGAASERLYVVASGRCEVRGAAGERLATLNVGDGVGEKSLLSRGPAEIDVVAVERTVALSLSRTAFDELAVVHPGLLAEVYRLRLEREQTLGDAVVHDASDLVL